MTSPVYRKGYLPTSTPIRPANEESGYFSNNQKNRWMCHSSTLKELSNLSPVKELSPVRKTESTKKITLIKDYNEEIAKENLENTKSRDKVSNFSGDNNNVVRAISFDCSLSSLINNNISITEHESFISSATYLSPNGKDSMWYKDDINDSCDNISLSEGIGTVLTSDRSPPSKKFQESPPVYYSNIKPRALTFNSTVKTDQSYSSVLTKNENIYNNILSSIKISNKHAYVNFVESLQMRNCDALISKIFRYLSDKDLCNVSFVSQHWRNAVLNDFKANKRRKEFLQQRKVFATGPDKENRFGERNVVSPRKKDIFNNISNNIIPSKVVEKSLINDLIHKSKFELFVEEGQKLNDNEILTKCPKCAYPAKSLRSDTRCLCTHKSCQYVFCNKCLGPYCSSTAQQSNFHKCIIKLQEKVKNEPKIIVCSKQSKKNLRRL